MPLRDALARHLRETRIALDVSQREVASAVGVSRGYVAHLELGAANPTLDVVDRLAAALGIELELTARRPTVDEPPRQRDAVHAWCSGYVDRRLRRAGWMTERKVEIVQGRHHGWIDLVAFDPSTATMIVIEVKTQLVDVGAVERQVAWYERSASSVARQRGWRVDNVGTWLLLLATDEVEESIRINRAVLAIAFPSRGPRVGELRHGRGLALIDPTSKRKAWLIAPGIDGRRSPARFASYADAARRLTR